MIEVLVFVFGTPNFNVVLFWQGSGRERERERERERDTHTHTQIDRHTERENDRGTSQCFDFLPRSTLVPQMST